MKGGTVIQSKSLATKLCTLSKRRSEYKRPVLSQLNIESDGVYYKGEKMVHSRTECQGTSHMERVTFTFNGDSYSFLHVSSPSAVRCSLTHAKPLGRKSHIIHDKTLTLNDLPSLGVKDASYLVAMLRRIVSCIYKESRVAYISLRPDNVYVSCGQDGTTEIFLDLARVGVDQTSFPVRHTEVGVVSDTDVSVHIEFQLHLLFLLLVLNHNSIAYKYIKEVYNIPYEETDFFQSTNQELPVLPTELHGSVFKDIENL
jgi:hypothetical protein